MHGWTLINRNGVPFTVRISQKTHMHVYLNFNKWVTYFDTTELKFHQSTVTIERKKVDVVCGQQKKIIQTECADFNCAGPNQLHFRLINVGTIFQFYLQIIPLYS